MKSRFLLLLAICLAGPLGVSAQDEPAAPREEKPSGVQTVGVDREGAFTVLEGQVGWQAGSPELKLDDQFANVTFPALSVRARVKTSLEVQSVLRLGVVWMVTDDYRKSRWTDAWQEEFASELPALRTQEPPWAAPASSFGSGEAVLSADLSWSATTLLKSRSRVNPGDLTQFGGSETWALCLAVFNEQTAVLTVLRRWDVKAGWAAQISGAAPRLTSFTLSIPAPAPLDDLPPAEAWNRSVLPRTSFYNGLRVE